MKNVIDLIFLGHLKFAKSLYRVANRFLANLTYLPHPKLSHNENWSFGDLVLANCLQQRFAIASQYFLVLVQNTTLNGDKNQKKPIVTPGGAECGI